MTNPSPRLGLALDFGHRSIRSRIAELLPVLRRAEESAFDSVWVGENYPQPPSELEDHVPSALVLLSYLAPITRLRLGTGVLLLPAWSPARLAYDAAVLDVLSGGRLTLGIGLGSPELQRRFGFEPSSFAPVFEDTLRYLKSAWAGREFRSSLFPTSGIVPAPSQEGGPRLLVAGSLDRSARRAAELGDGYYAATGYGLERIRRLAGVYRSAVRGRTAAATGVVAANRIVVIARSSTEARAIARSGAGRVLEVYRRRGVLASYRRRSTLEGLEGVDLDAVDGYQVFDRLGDRLCLFGTAAEVAEQLRAYAGAGVTDVNARVAPPGVSIAAAIRTVTELQQIQRA